MQSLGIPGRQPRIVIDYAHTPDALAKALAALKPYQQGKLWCVMGCGGNRDAAKRPLMGRVAESLCDELIITNDNPRNEPPESIVAAIKSGLSQPEAATVIFDRKAAIVHAIAHAAIHDTILIAGKGHEAYQHMGAEKIPLSDAGVVQQHISQVNETF
jgi:UDP-N-acetylmuramoyl-L-alanyl-D-glutamate--2,6-diaminopimelate ligase